MSVQPPQCHIRKCAHYQGVRYLDEEIGEPTEVVFCLAFPNGIPEEIAYGDNLHLEFVDGDNGILYEKATKEQQETL